MAHLRLSVFGSAVAGNAFILVGRSLGTDHEFGEALIVARHHPTTPSDFLCGLQIDA